MASLSISNNLFPQYLRAKVSPLPGLMWYEQGACLSECLVLASGRVPCLEDVLRLPCLSHFCSGRWAMIEMLRVPRPEFAAAIRLHFKLRGPKIQAGCRCSHSHSFTRHTCVEPLFRKQWKLPPQLFIVQ